ncbi:MAG TPA: hypothetical protein VHX68_20310, partial [Planctomycetaceae bacterium]|nr:hypothetical protein [Planctomycetaceae bacterium]
MKRAVLMGVFAAIMATAWTFLAAQQGQSPNLKQPIPTLAPTYGAERVTPSTAEPGARPPLAEPVVAAPAAESSLSPLQQRFIELSTRKARSLKEEQLQKLVNDLNEEVEGLNAWSKVDEGARVLRDVADKSPQTPAGRAAKAALRILDQYRSNNELVPDPDHGVGRQHERERFTPQSDPKFTPSPPVDKT